MMSAGQNRTQVPQVALLLETSTEYGRGLLRGILRHVKQTLSVDQIAEELRVSRRTIERRFLRSVGRTILSEIIRNHLRRAKQLLTENDLPCHVIGVESGFGSLKSFTRSFKQNEGTTPQAFRIRRAL